MRQTTLALCAAIALASAGYAQAETAKAPAAAGQTQPPATQPTIKKVNIVPLQELSEAAQKQVNDVTAQATETDLKKLRTAVGENPQVMAALQAKGLSSENVIAAGMAPDGTLTLVTKES
jgi:hypothetical protein